MCAIPVCDAACSPTSPHSLQPPPQELSPDKLGFAKCVREVGYGTTKDRSIIIEGCPNLSAVTIWVRGGNRMVLDEVRRSLHDALCVARNLVSQSCLVFDGGTVAQRHRHL